MKSLRIGEYQPLGLDMIVRHGTACLLFWLLGLPLLAFLPLPALRLAGGALGVFLSMLAVLDFRYGLLYDRLLLPMALLGLGLELMGVLPAGAEAALAASLGAAGCFGALRFASGGGLGLGDVKFATVLGIWLGYPGIVVATALAVCLGGLWAFGLLLRGHGAGECLPFGPCLSLGAYISYIFGEIIWQSYWEMLL